MARRTLLILSLVIGILFGSAAVYAHVTGTFKDFLAGVKDESTLKKLNAELASTKQEIESLKPQVDEQEKAYQKKLAVSKAKLQFYNSIGLDTYFNLIQQSGDIVEALSNVQMVQNRLKRDLDGLNQLYADYMTLKVSKESLQGHVALLNMIQTNLEARQAFLASQKGKSDQQIAEQVAQMWQKDVGPYVMEGLFDDFYNLGENIQQEVTRETPQSPYRIEEQTLNKSSKLQYFIRSDHVYTHFKKGAADVILLGTINQAGDTSATYDIEAGFINGVQLSLNMVIQLSGFELDVAKLDPKGKESYFFEQTNGALIIQPKSQAVE